MDVENFIHSLQDDYQPRAYAAAKRGIYKFALHVLAEAQILCPVSPTLEYIPGKGPPRGKEMIKNPLFTGHSGRLKDSAMAEDPVDEGDFCVVTIGFNTSYAAAVHEVLTAFHPTGQAKFLETAMRANAPQMVEFIIKEINAEFGS